MNLSDVKMTFRKGRTDDAEIFIDGVEQTRVSWVELYADAKGGIVRLSLGVEAPTVQIDGQYVVQRFAMWEGVSYAVLKLQKPSKMDGQFRLYKTDENGFSKDVEPKEAYCDFCHGAVANTRVVAYKSDPSDCGICEECWAGVGAFFAEQKD